MKKIIFIILLLFYSNSAFAKKIAIFAHTSEEQGNNFYEKNTKSFGFERKLSLSKLYNSEYHVTLGFIEEVEKDDIKELKSLISSRIKNKVKNLYFEFGPISLLGRGAPFIVSIPLNIEDFIILNKEINDILLNFKNHKYILSEFTMPESFIPHLSLNAKLHKHVKIENLTNIMLELNKDLFKKKLILSKLVIKVE